MTITTRSYTVIEGYNGKRTALIKCPDVLCGATLNLSLYEISEEFPYVGHVTPIIYCPYCNRKVGDMILDGW